MSTNRTAFALSAVAVVAFGTAWWRQEQINDELRAELGRLRGGTAAGVGPGEAPPSALADPAAWDRRAAAERAELARMRTDIAALKTRTQEIAHLAVRAADGTAPLNLVPSQGWKNAGRETPTAAIETLLWAADGGEVDALAATLTLDPAAREKAAAILGRLPESARAGIGRRRFLCRRPTTHTNRPSLLDFVGPPLAGGPRLVRLRRGPATRAGPTVQIRRALGITA